MPHDADAQELLAHFARCAWEHLITDGWTAKDEHPAAGDSIFLGTFERPVADAFVATAEFTLESGPVTRGVLFLPDGPRPVRELRAVVGGELGACHLPTRDLLTALQISCEPNISLDLADLLESQKQTLPVMSTNAEAEHAARVLATAANRHGLAFARRYATVEDMLQFIAEGRQTDHDELFAAILAPTLLAAAGRYSAAEFALSGYRKRFAERAEERDEYEQAIDRLATWLADPSG